MDEEQLEKSYKLNQKEPPDENGYIAYSWERIFLNAFLTKYGTITKSATDAGVTEQMVIERAKEEPTFAWRLEYCREQLRDSIRHEVIRRALEPVEKPIYNRGKLIAVEYVWDNRHLQWVAERMLPKEFHLPSLIESGGDGDVNFRLELGPGTTEEDEK